MPQYLVISLRMDALLVDKIETSYFVVRASELRKYKRMI
jgi:hypothetical protein